MFPIGPYSIVEIGRLFKADLFDSIRCEDDLEDLRFQKYFCFSEEQWANVFCSKSIAKELMQVNRNQSYVDDLTSLQSTADVWNMYEHDQADKAKYITKESTIRQLKTFSLVLFCSQYAADIAQGSLPS